jgi:microcystin-dependent protein
MAPFIGEIRLFVGNFAPSGWAFCDGQQLPISENDALFTLIGTTYGGDGQETFALPDLRGRAPVHMGTGPGGVTKALAETGGTEQETLTVQQTPIHTHPYTASSSTGNISAPSNNVLAEVSLATPYIFDTPSASLAPQAATPAGGSQPHENMQPYLVISFIISLFGVFPTQT